MKVKGQWSLKDEDKVSIFWKSLFVTDGGENKLERLSLAQVIFTNKAGVYGSGGMYSAPLCRQAYALGMTKFVRVVN